MGSGSHIGEAAAASFVEVVEQVAVQEMREDGLSHAEVGRELGLSRARAQQIAEGRTTGKRAVQDQPPTP